jgi:hypothetical protein
MCLSLNSRFAGSNPAEGDEFLRAIKICSATSFGGEVKSLATCRRFYSILNNPLMYERDIS